MERESHIRYAQPMAVLCRVRGQCYRRKEVGLLTAKASLLSYLTVRNNLGRKVQRWSKVGGMAVATIVGSREPQKLS